MSSTLLDYIKEWSSLSELAYEPNHDVIGLNKRKKKKKKKNITHTQIENQRPGIKSPIQSTRVYVHVDVSAVF